MPRHTKHTMRTTLPLDDENRSEVTIYVSYSYWPGMAGTYYDPPEEDSADWTRVEAEDADTRRTRPLIEDEMIAFEAWWEADGQHEACQSVGWECAA